MDFEYDDFQTDVKVEEEEDAEVKPDIIDCGGPVLKHQQIKDFVRKLQRYEIDKLIEHIDEKVLSGDFSTKMSVIKVIEEIEKLEIEDANNFNMKRYAIIYNIVDSFGKEELDIFLEVVEMKLESGFENDTSRDELNSSEIEVENDSIENFFKCHICTKDFECVEELELHVEKFHLRSPVTFFCSICDQKFEEKRQLRMHIRKVHCNEEIHCLECEQIFETEELLTAHISEIHFDKELNVTCPHCQDLVQEHRLEDHMKENHQKKSSRKKVFVGSNLKCNDCDKTFGNSQTLERHTKRFHTSNKGPKVMCEICNTEVNDKKTHMKSHEEKKFQCEQCPKRYRTKFDLKTHMKSVHLGVKESCPHCGKLTANLSKHIYGNHMHEFPCEICGKVFARQTQLNYHLRAHERGTIIEKAPPDVLKEKKKMANLKYLEKRRERKKDNKELHEHEKTLKRVWARKNREKLMKYKKEYYERKREGVVKHFKVGEGGILKEESL
eukprot:GFUD01001524.1.p1 GENE.GFUD01001524.1~~GFUD01001524.1.p1  ORF type:complete len:496 (+),score=120.83 GFUD01001524.1:54-1541(+)